jgi:two-component system chemotaxis response regulator CheB
MRVTRGHEIRLSDNGNEPYRTSGNVLFQSLAESFGTRAIGIVLTGCLSDGAAGTSAIRNAGGRVFVQAPEHCEYADMPSAAMRTGAVDLALSVRSLAAAITAIVTVPGASGVFTVGDSYRQALATQACPRVHRSPRLVSGHLLP